jgi:hypothetical protein
MGNIKLLKVVNILLFLAFLTTLVGVALYKYPLIPALQGSEGVGELHEIGGMLFFLLALCHLYLNLNWIKSQIFGIKPKGKRK